MSQSRFLSVFCAFLGMLAMASGADDKARVVVGKCVTESGSIMRRPAGSSKWEIVKKDEAIYSGDVNVGLPGAVIESKNGAIRLALLADLDGTSPFPVMESAVILHASDKLDLDFTLDRGRVDLTSEKKAHAQVRFHKEDWDLVMEPKTRIALELYGRWPAGVFCDLKKPLDKQSGPTANLAVLVLEGEALLDHDDHKHSMRAPPGPALFLWDSVVQEDVGPRRLDKLPEWADPNTPPGPLAKRKKATLDLYRQRALAVGPEKAVEEALASGDFGYQRLGAVVLGATDNVGRLVDILNDPKASADAREGAILVLRHWIGRCHGQDPKLYDVLVKQKGLSPAHAELVLLGLHSLCDVEQGRPETWEALIHYLVHDQQIIRELAHWHLTRLVPGGRLIPYDAAAPLAQLKEAHDKWKKLIPDGKLPPIVQIKQKLKDLKDKPDDPLDKLKDKLKGLKPSDPFDKGK